MVILCLAELFGGGVDWFSSSKLTPPAASVSSSVWSDNDAAFSAVTNGHIDVWPTLTSSGILFCITLSVMLFSALTLLVGWKEEHPARKKTRAMRCWHSCVSEARCK